MPEKSRNPDRFKAAILVASDRAHSGRRADATGILLNNRLRELGFEVLDLKILPDNREMIKDVLTEWVNKRINLILATGGTGIAARDVTPEATLDIIEKRIPGMEEAMRRASADTTPFGMLSRGVVGTVDQSLIVDLPGNSRGALENLAVIEPALEHALLLLVGESPDP